MNRGGGGGEGENLNRCSRPQLYRLRQKDLRKEKGGRKGKRVRWVVKLRWAGIKD